MMAQEMSRVMVIGAGPSGLMAAGQCARSGTKTTLLEKTEAVGKKLSITGKKRCNLTNTADLRAFIDHFGSGGRFLHQSFNQFFRDDLLDFFSELGVTAQSERGGRIFPANGDAQFVTQKLADWVQRSGAQVRLRTPVKQLIITDGCISAVETAANQIIPSHAVVLCTGGATFPGTGSTGDGYRMAQDAGHTIVPLRPALVPLKTSGSTAQKMQGVSLRNIRLHVFFDDKKVIDVFGEMLFTHFGISGPLVLTHSGEIVDALRVGKRVSVSIDLKPALDNKKLDARMIREFDQNGKKQLRSILKHLLPSKMVPVCAEHSHISLDSLCHQVTSDERKRLVEWMKGIHLEISGSLPLETGMVTMGGVSLEEVDPRTMMSKVVRGLFLAGEVLDLAADTGGFNLQAAFSTGWLAGRQASDYVKTHTPRPTQRGE